MLLETAYYKMSKKKNFCVVISFLLLIALAFAEEGGCCFDPSIGICTENADLNSCSPPGQYFDSPTCSVSVCEKGCCNLGTVYGMMTQAECAIRARAYGFDSASAWLGVMEIEDCNALAEAKTEGACLYPGEYEINCDYTTLENCPTGEFTAGILCSDPSLGTICEATEESFCDDGDAYFLDSCNNRGELKEDCDYSLGTICREEGTEAGCVDLNCEDADGSFRSNGEQWCVEIEDTEEEDFFSAENLIGSPENAESMAEYYDFTEKIGYTYAVGSRFYKKYCVNGEITTMGCANKRAEYCEEGVCKVNNYEGCYDAETEEDCLEAGTCVFTNITLKGDYPDEFRLFSTDGTERHWWGGKDGFQPTEEERRGREEREAGEGEGPGKCYGGYGYERERQGWQDITLSMCMPAITPGTTFYSSSESSEGETEAETICSLGDWAGSVTLRRPEGDDEKHSTNKWCCYENCNLLSFFLNSTELQTSRFTKEPDPNFETLLMLRCQALGDCAGKVNYLGEEGAEVLDEIEVLSPTGDSRHKTYELKFECKAFEPPDEGNCKICSEDGYPCSEYRCKSIAKNCEYNEELEYCYPSEDFSPPVISHVLFPESPIPPFTSLEIDVLTDELSSCRFNFGIGNAGTSYDEMENEVGFNWSYMHKMRLSLPGQIPIEEERLNYDFITEDGLYEVYVRCIDPAGNWNLEAYLIQFEVMQSPDYNPPIISDFVPVSGSPVKYNTTTKQISFRLNEPAECKWDFDDKNFSSMLNSFECNTEPADTGLVYGYFCSGNLTNITTNISQQSLYYIRCKDQPWLETENPDPTIYKRNENTESEEYILRPSEKLEIIELTPNGNLFLSASDNLLQLKAATIGGGVNGVAECSWKLTNSELQTGIYSLFENTNSSEHTQTITLISEGRNQIDVKCKDEAENEAEKTETFNITIDRKAPDITRAYKLGSSLIIITNEDAVCKYVNHDPACLFDFDSENATTMIGSSKYHSTNWQEDKSYYIRCQDYYENTNTGCEIVIRTY